MANFQTHLTVATVTSALASSVAISLQLVSETEVIALWLLGVIGGLLPDIDSDDSTALNLLFTLMAMVAAMFTAMCFYNQLSVIGLWLAGALVFVFVRYTLVPIFERFTVHRGSIHSLLVGVLFAVAAVHISVLCHMGLVFSWCVGIFILLGFLTHLSLDELYSVDLSNLTVKRSFGTALKPASLAYPLVSTAQLLVCATLIYFMPSPEPLLSAIERADIEFLPVDEWHSIKALVGA